VAQEKHSPSPFTFSGYLLGFGSKCKQQISNAEK